MILLDFPIPFSLLKLDNRLGTLSTIQLKHPFALHSIETETKYSLENVLIESLCCAE